MRISDWSSDVCSSDLRGRKPCPKREDFRPKEKGAAPRDRPFLCPVCPNGSESDAETDREGVEISEIIDELVAIFGLGIGVGAQLVLIADARIGIVDVGEGEIGRAHV